MTDTTDIRTRPLLRQPFPHQRLAIEQLKLWGGRALLCDEMGLGKSSTALWTLDELGADRIIVVCPLSVTDKWCDEVDTTLDRPNAVLRQLRHAVDAPNSQPDNAVLVLHYDLVVKLPDAVVEGLLKSCNAGLILDESHYVKNRTALRSKAVRKLAARAKYVLCLTGTPVRNDIRDLWHQVQLARPGHLYDYARFEARFTKQKRFQLPSMKRPVMKFEGTRNEAELATRLHDVMVMRKKSDVVDLPPKVRTLVPLEMGKAERERYDEMKRVAMVTLADIARPHPMAGMTIAHGSDNYQVDELWKGREQVIARTALEQVIRLEQLTCGVLGGSSLDKPIAFPDAAKIEWTLETIEDLRQQGRSVVVFCKFNATLQMLVDMVPREKQLAVGFTGEAKAEDRDVMIQAFRTSKEPAVLAVQLKLAEGFDLTPCTDAIFLGIDWTPAAMDQAEDRLHRIGTTGTVNCYYPICTRSIDKRLYNTVVEKREDAKRVLEYRQVMEELA